MSRILKQISVLILTLSLGLFLVGCGSQASAPKEPVKSNQSDKAPDSTPVNNTDNAPSNNTGGAPMVEEEDCGC